MTDTVSPDFWQGVDQFNQGEFYACHDTLEAIWMEAAEPQRTFYQGILQLAVALYHLGNHNWQGTVTLLGEGIHRLRPYQPTYAMVDVTSLVDAAAELLTLLQHAGPDRVAEMAKQSDQTRLDQPSGESTEGAIALPSLVIQQFVE